MSTIFSNPAGSKFISFIWMINIKFWKKNRFGGSSFSALSKSQKSTSTFWKTPETKKMRNKTFNCSKLLLFFKTIKVNRVKNVKKNVQNCWLFAFVAFLAFTKSGKSASPEVILAGKYFFVKILFSIIHMKDFNLKKKVVHCYSLNFGERNRVIIIFTQFK